MGVVCVSNNSVMYDHTNHPPNTHPPLFLLLNARYHVKPPIGLNSPAQLFTDCNLLQEVTSSLFLSTLLLECSTKVTHVLRCTQLRDPRQKHKGEERD